MKTKRIRNNDRKGRRLERWKSPVGHELLEEINHLGHLAVDENPVPMDQMTIKTSNSKCRLYMCLIEFIDWRWSVMSVFSTSLVN
jgi:hypothetical protein